MRPYLAELARIAECYVSSYPNAGLPNAFGEYDELPAETGELVADFATSGFVNIVGGCCGTTPDHIAAIARRGRGHSTAEASSRAHRHRTSDIATSAASASPSSPASNRWSSVPTATSR